ncbi:MAG: L,D-transpeptidase [Chlamydiia bacterium]|nr:L,D-transpeptidase [Chlamydiia bacterium]
MKRLLIALAVVLCGGIFLISKMQTKESEVPEEVQWVEPGVVEVALDALEEETQPERRSKERERPTVVAMDGSEELLVFPDPDVDRVRRLFDLGNDQLPIVETLVYHSQVPWLKGRPAWVADYSAHFETSRHFIARSLNRSLNYFKQDVRDGDRFNVFRLEHPIRFYLLVDISQSKLWFYYHDLTTDERVLLKTYPVVLGKKRLGVSLTPVGKFPLGDRIAIYKPKTMGFFRGKKIEMIRVFGTRWIPIDVEFEDDSFPERGYGIHGMPWQENSEGILEEDLKSVPRYASDGCIRMRQKDIEELFAIVITKPTEVEVVQHFEQAHLPGVEKNL